MEANKTFEILPQSFEIPQLQKMFTKEQLTQKLLEFGLYFLNAYLYIVIKNKRP